jgi:hypothetical protein
MAVDGSNGGDFVANEDFISLDFEDDKDGVARGQAKGKEKAKARVKQSAQKKERDNKGKKRDAAEAGLDGKSTRDKQRVTPWARAVPWEACLDPAQM